MLRQTAAVIVSAFALAGRALAVPAANPTAGDLREVDAATSTSLALGRTAQASPPGTAMRIAGLRDGDGRPLTFALEVGRLFSPDFKLYLDGRETPTDAPQRLVYLHGTAEQWPGSSVAISLDASTGAWNGTLVRADGVFALGAPGEAAALPLAAVAAVRPADLTGVERGAVSDALEAAGVTGRRSAEAVAKRVIPAPGGIYGAALAIDTDHEFLGNGSVAEGETRVHDIIAGVSELYERQLGVPLAIRSLFLYPDEDDPWNAPNPHTGSEAEVLCEFGKFWQSHRPLAAYPRNAALFFTGKSSTEISGQAWLSSLCSFNTRPSACPPGGYGIVVRGRFVQRDVLVTAHELGHIFGSSHTHCYRPEIDQCWAEERGCYSGPVSAPTEGGSVMSYCNAANLSMGEPGLYGDRSERVIGVIRSLVDRVGPACLGRVNDPYALAAQPGDGEATLTWVDPFGNETNWLVEQLVKGKFKQIKSLPPNTTSITIGGLKAGEQTFRVRAKIKRDVSDYSASVNVTIP